MGSNELGLEEDTAISQGFHWTRSWVDRGLNNNDLINRQDASNKHTHTHTHTHTNTQTHKHTHTHAELKTGIPSYGKPKPTNSFDSCSNL